MGKNYGKITQQIDAKLQAAKIKIKPCCIVNDAWLTIKPCQIVTFLCICLQWCKLTLYDYLLIPQKLSFFAWERERERERETEWDRENGYKGIILYSTVHIFLRIKFIFLWQLFMFFHSSITIVQYSFFFFCQWNSLYNYEIMFTM